MNVLTHPEFAILQKINTPQKIQTFLEEIPFNHEKSGETCMSPLRVLREGRAHCIEGAMLACVALMIHGEKPLIMNLKVETSDYDHIITLFKRNGYWGGISKTNHLVLRYRDPVYKTIRELAMSYFHEYFLSENGAKTMLGYTDPINMRRFGTQWMIAEGDLWDIAEVIYDTPYKVAVPQKNRNYVRIATPFERMGTDIQEWPE